MMRIDLSCPVEAWKVRLPQEGQKECDVTLFNLSSLQVVSVEVTLLLSSEDGEETAKIIHRGRGLNGAPGKVFHMVVPVEGHIEARRYEVTIEKVWYDNASVWRREKDGMTEYRPNNLHRSPQLTTLRAIAGSMASGYPDQQSGLWVCVCGRPNLDETANCARCHQQKAEVFARYSREAVEAEAAAREHALAEHGREALQQTATDDHRDFVRRKPKFGWLVRLTAGLVILTGLGWAAWEYGVPHVQYQLALRDLNGADYVQAEEAFTALGDYQDAAEWARKARYEQAKDLLHQEASEDELLKAREIFRSLGDYEDAASLVSGCDVLLADIRFDQARYSEARELYLGLAERPGYESEANARLTEIAYIEARMQLESGEWERAREAFAALGDYQDSASLRLDTWYHPAVQAMNEGDAATALALLAEIPGHRDADTLVKQIHYDEGVALRAEGKINEAAEAFYLAIGYKDAADQANECFYVPATIAYETMEYEEAAALFSKILDYRDSREKWRTSTLEAARTAMEQINYRKALTFLGQLPADDAEAAVLIKDCTYEPARGAYIRGEYEEAIRQFTLISGHRDANDMLLRCKYDWAADLHEDGEYESAAALYAELAEYEDAADKLRDVQYGWANLLITSLDPADVDRAVSLYASLGDYRDAADRLIAANAAKAEALLSSGDAAGAKALFAAMPQDEATLERIQACDHALAAQLAAEGKVQEAIAAFTALGDYADSAEQVLSLRYQAAIDLSNTDPEAAIAALTELGDYADSAVQIDVIRYNQAKDMIETDRAAALAAFVALGDYGDAADQANALRYADAQALLDTDRAAAIEAFVALGDYSDAADRANALRYEDARAMEDTGDWQTAAALYDLIPGYEDSTARADQLRYDAGLAYAEAEDWENAALAFSAMSGETDSAEQVNLLRYQAAEELLAAGNKEGAAVAFLAISGYGDAKDRANAIRYEQAEALAVTDWEAAARAFEALGDYQDAQDRAKALYYNQAAKLAASGDWRGATEMYASLGDYSDAAAKVMTVRYDAAAAYAAAGQWEDAIALYTELGNYADCPQRVNMTRYSQAESIAAAGDYLAAEAVFRALGTYSDSAARADQMLENYYAGPATAIASAHEKENWAEVIQVMGWLDTTRLPQKYQYLFDLYHNACYKEGNRLYKEQKPYDALRYYKELPDGYGDLNSRMQQPCYLILGTWEDLQGNRYIFREEGVCSLNGENVFFVVDGTSMYTGKQQDMLAVTHRLTGVNRSHAWLYDQRGEKEITIYLTRVTD